MESPPRRRLQRSRAQLRPAQEPRRRRHHRRLPAARYRERTRKPSATTCRAARSRSRTRGTTTEPGAKNGINGKGCLDKRMAAARLGTMPRLSTRSRQRGKLLDRLQPADRREGKRNPAHTANGGGAHPDHHDDSSTRNGNKPVDLQRDSAIPHDGQLLLSRSS